MNQETYLQNLDKPLSAVLEGFHQSFPIALAMVEGISESDLIDPDRYAWRDGRPLWFIVAANTFWHYDEHESEIRGWIEASLEK